jgi:hypothetical protein
MSAVLFYLPPNRNSDEGRLRVGNTSSQNEEAAVRGHQRLKDRLPAYCRPTPTDRSTAGQAEVLK